MNLNSTSFVDRSPLIILTMISLTLLVCCIVLNSSEKKGIKNYIITLIISVFSLVYFVCHLEINLAIYHDSISKLSFISIAVNKIPLYIQYLIFFFIIAFCIIEFRNLKKYSKKIFTPRTICEVIDNLPMGLAFYDANGFLYLSNRIMNEICMSITDKDLQNGIELENDIQVLQTTQKCVIKGAKPSFMLDDKSVWRFFKSQVIIDGIAYTKLQADDMTQVFHLADNIRHTNKMLKIEQLRLQQHMKNINQYISEEETLRVKMMVHDDFGEMIALTVQCFEGNDSCENKANVLKRWGNLSKKMGQLLNFDIVKSYSVEDTITFAEQLGAEIEIIGDIPQKKEYSQLIIRAMHESVKNAVYHAHADKLTVSITTQKDKYIISFFNKDKNIGESITLGGGLSSIKQQVEAVDGKMEVICNNGVELKITLIRE